MKQDLTEGKIGKKLILFFLPIAAGTLFQQLYNAADAVIVGKFVGTVALAAVGGSAANVTNLLIGFFVALSGGSSVVIAQLFGAKDESSMQKATGTSIAFCLVAGIALTAVGLIFTPAFLKLLKSPDDTMSDAVAYLRIIFAGVIPTLLYNIEAGILRAVGDSRTPFYYLLISCISNIVLDLVFVIFFRLGVVGVAVATVFSQIISAALATVKLMRSKESFRICLHEIRFDRRLLRRMMHIGIPAGLQASMYGVSNMILQVYVNLLGTTVVAAWSLSGKLDGFYWACASAAGTAVMNFAAQNCGANRMDRVKSGTRLSLLVFTGVTLAFSAVLLLIARPVLPIFTNDSAVVQTTWLVMIYIVPTYFTWTFIEILSGILRGVGDSVIPVVICGLGICLLRVVWIAVAFHFSPTLFTVSMSYPISWIVTDIAFILYYKKGRWQERLHV